MRFEISFPFPRTVADGSDRSSSEMISTHFLSFTTASMASLILAESVSVIGFSSRRFVADDVSFNSLSLKWAGYESPDTPEERKSGWLRAKMNFGRERTFTNPFHSSAAFKSVSHSQAEGRRILLIL